MTNPKQLGVAVVGSGRIGTLRAHMASRHPSVRFLAVSDKDPARAQALAKATGAQLASGDNREVIAHPDVDAVIVSTSEHEHAEPLLQAIELGKPILVEKPLALRLEDADRIVAAAERKGVDIRVGYSRRHDRRWMLAKEQILQGRLGQIVGATARVYNSRAQMFEILKRSPEASPITDVLTYYVDMACWFLEGNRPVEVVARGQWKLFKERGHDAQDVTWTIITFEDGAVVNLGVCYILPAAVSNLRPERSLRGAGHRGRDLARHGQQGQRPLHRPGCPARLCAGPRRQDALHAEQLVGRLGGG